MSRESLIEAMEYGIAKLGESAEHLGGFPHTTNRGRWQPSEHGRWTAGFWIGALWLAYLHTEDERWA
ncbi:MAG TPA: glucuronyl hydrolase, partial [Chloroflexota bacterium]|nr:glucuronyl hydrolase [Chloroflexota bacterium]